MKSSVPPSSPGPEVAQAPSPVSERSEDCVLYPLENPAGNSAEETAQSPGDESDDSENCQIFSLEPPSSSETSETSGNTRSREVKDGDGQPLFPRQAPPPFTSAKQVAGPELERNPPQKFGGPPPEFGRPPVPGAKFGPPPAVPPPLPLVLQLMAVLENILYEDCEVLIRNEDEDSELVAVDLTVNRLRRELVNFAIELEWLIDAQSETDAAPNGEQELPVLVSKNRGWMSIFIPTRSTVKPHDLRLALLQTLRNLEKKEL